VCGYTVGNLGALVSSWYGGDKEVGGRWEVEGASGCGIAKGSIGLEDAV